VRPVLGGGGVWPFVGLPPLVNIGSRQYARARWRFPIRGVVAQYRECRDCDAAHLFVRKDGTWIVTHTDRHNPDRGHPILHFLRDTFLGRRLRNIARRG
jgi:hypothetical protein